MLKKVFDDIKRWKDSKFDRRAYLARIKALPKDYRIVYDGINHYMWSVALDGTAVMNVIFDILDMLENGVRENKNVLDIVGSDIIGFCDEILKELPNKTWVDKMKPLREWIANRMNSRLGTHFESENILITHGSQQALDLSGKVFLDEGDVVLCESPTYLAAISAFRAYECKFIEVQTDDDGMIACELEKILENTDRVKIIYVIPDFQNPTGKTWSLERRN